MCEQPSTPQISLRRLSRLSHHLLTKVPGEISLNEWVTYPPHKSEALHNEDNVLKNIMLCNHGVSSCPTVHASMIPAFQRMGLTPRIVLAKNSLEVFVDVIYIPTHSPLNYFQGKHAVCKFFMLTMEEFDYVFESKSYFLCVPTRKSVATRIGLLCKSRQAQIQKVANS